MSQALFDKAIHLEESGRLGAALDIWRELAASEPTRNAFLRLAAAAEESGAPDEAQRAFNAALALDGQCVLALEGLGNLALDRGDGKTAIEYLTRAGALEQRPSTLTLLGAALRNAGRDLEAEDTYRRAIRLDPEYEEAYFNLGVLLRDRPSEAAALFRRALDLDPDYGPAHRELGWLLHHRHEPGDSESEAESHIRRAVSLDHGDAWAHIYLGSILWASDTDAAIAEFRSAHNLNDRWTVPLWSLGNIHEFVLKDYASARSFFERAHTLDPDDVVTLSSLGRLCRKLGETESAKHYLRRALTLDPGHPSARELLESIVS